MSLEMANASLEWHSALTLAVMRALVQCQHVIWLETQCFMMEKTILDFFTKT